MSWAADEIFTKRELSYWLAFSQLSGPGLGVQKTLRLFEHYRSLEPAWLASSAELKRLQFLTENLVDAFVAQRQTIDPLQLLQIISDKDVQAYPLMHPEYPALLREIADPPVVLYMKGKLTSDDLMYAIGVVGTRRPTSYGTRMVKEISSGLAASGVTVVSGMAVGIDSLAHWGAIDGGGKTVAVLACGVDICYPSSNKPLYTRLCEGKHGAVISEFFPGTKVDDWRFPARNRIISGVSKGLCVIEAGQTSGSLITARLAFEQDRDVFAVPGRTDQPMSEGTNQLIANNVAKLIFNHNDILREKDWVSSAQPGRDVPTVIQLFGRERDLYEMLSNEPVHFDMLSEKTGMSAGELSATLTMLELAGVVARHPGDWYSRDSSATTVAG